MTRIRPHIQSLADLQSERLRLKSSYLLREEALKNNAKTYIHQLSPLYFLNKLTNSKTLFKIDEKTNITGKMMSVILPFILNKTLFRGSGLITKTLGALISGKIGNSLDADQIAGVVSHVKSFITSLFSKSQKKSKPLNFADYGIPPDSETY
ncbi:hypothetical protein [Pedobacter sp.]|uniref:hypothetical protein n=1 Tax=Pedobacter sp. TaxID=1411316 RepID=UPI00396CFCB9